MKYFHPRTVLQMVVKPLVHGSNVSSSCSLERKALKAIGHEDFSTNTRTSFEFQGSHVTRTIVIFVTPNMRIVSLMGKRSCL